MAGLLGGAAFVPPLGPGGPSMGTFVRHMDFAPIARPPLTNLPPARPPPLNPTVPQTPAPPTAAPPTTPPPTTPPPTTPPTHTPFVPLGPVQQGAPPGPRQQEYNVAGVGPVMSYPGGLQPGAHEMFMGGQGIPAYMLGLNPADFPGGMIYLGTSTTP